MTQSETMQPMDFLDRIVAKAQGVESAIAPRLPSLFEPMAGAIVVSPEEYSEQPASVVATEAGHIGADPLRRAPQRATAQEPRAAGIPHLEVRAGRDEARKTDDAEAHITEKLPNPVASLLSSTRVPNFVERMVTRATGDAAMAAPESDFVYGVKQQQSAEALSSSDTPTRVRRTPISVNTSLARNSESTPARSGELSREPPDQGHKIGDPESGVLTPAPLAALALRIGIVPAPKFLNEIGRASLANEPEPHASSINVTIGRVEVRAVQASSAKPRFEPAKSKPLSLDDYLKQRGGRR